MDSEGPSTQQIVAELLIPEDEIGVPILVTGHLEIAATYAVSYGGVFGVFDDRVMETKDVSFWVYPLARKPAIDTEMDMYRRTTVLIPTLILASSALVPPLLLGDVDSTCGEGAAPQTRRRKRRRSFIAPPAR